MSGVFTKEGFTKHLFGIPDEKFVGLKLNSAYYRKQEFYNMNIKDIEEHNRLIIPKVHQTVNHIQCSIDQTV